MFLIPFLIVISLYLIFYIFYNPDYKRGWIPLEKAGGMLDTEILQGFTYHQIIIIFNLIYSIRKEMKKPSFFRFIKYRITKKENKELEFIYTAIANRLDAIERAHKQGDLQHYEQ